MSFRRFAVLLITLVAVAMGGTVKAQNKVVVYSANDGNLNRFVFDGFTKETGIAVEGVEAGSGVLFRRIASEREKPLGDIIWGVSRALLQSNKGLLAPYASKNKGATPADFRDPDDLWIGTNVHLLVILQNTKILPVGRRPKILGGSSRPEMEGQDRIHRPGQFRLRLHQRDHARAALGSGRPGLGKSVAPAGQHQGAQPLDAGIPGRRQRRIPARHVA